MYSNFDYFIKMCNFFYYCHVFDLQVTEKDIDVRIIIAALAPLVIVLSFIRSLERLAYLSLLANFLCFLGLVITFQYLARCLQSPKKFPAFAGLSKLPLFFGTAIFSFEGIGVVSLHTLLWNFVHCVFRMVSADLFLHLLRLCCKYYNSYKYYNSVTTFRPGGWWNSKRRDGQDACNRLLDLRRAVWKLVLWLYI